MVAAILSLSLWTGESPSWVQLAAVLLVTLLYGSRLPEVASFLGKGIVDFKRGIKGLEDEVGPLLRRATVRYYNRMNPERVYPLLVVISRDEVARAARKGTDQRDSSPFAIDPALPIEVEPVLPGCDCYPPRVITRLGDGDLTLAFRIVPRVLGKVDGAVLRVRQDHSTLAEVPLGMKVVKRLWVTLAGLATFLVPGLSEVMKHFGLDFEAQREQGFSLYLTAASVVFDHCSPYALAALLGVATVLLWWLTRPRERDQFWEVRPAR